MRYVKENRGTAMKPRPPGKLFARLAVVAAGVLFGGIATPSCYAIDEGKPAPALAAKTIDGQPFMLAAERGHVVIVNFWATWCSPCREEMPALDAYYRQHKDHGLRVLAISMDDPRDDKAVREVMHAFSYPAAFEREADHRGYGRIWRMPMTFVIDRQGILRKDGGTGVPLLLDAATLEKIV